MRWRGIIGVIAVSVFLSTLITCGLLYLYSYMLGQEVKIYMARMQLVKVCDKIIQTKDVPLMKKCLKALQEDVARWKQ